MIGLVLKDIFCMKQFLRTYFGMTAFFAVFAFFMKSPEYLVFMAMIMGINMIFSIFSIDEVGGYSYSLCLPVDRGQIVKGRYLVMLLGMALILALTLVFGAVIALVTGYEGGSNWVWTALCAVGFYFFCMSLVMPVAFRWKADRARIVLIGVVVLPVFLILILDNLGVDLDGILENVGNLKVMALSFLAFSLVCYVISCFAAIRLFGKKEF